MTPRLPLLAAIVALGTTTLAAPCAALDAPNVAYIYDTDTVARDAFGTMLRSAGFDVTTVAMADVETHNFAAQDLIIIGSDTGAFYTWGTAPAVANVVASDKPMIGLALGGTAFFHQLGLYISYGLSMGGSCTGVVVENPAHPLWTSPNPIPIEPDGTVAMYTSGSSALMIYMTIAPAEVTCYGRAIGFPSHCGVASEQWTGPFAALWSMQDLPDDMTVQGRDLFSNLVWQGLYSAGWIFADGFESADTSAWTSTAP